MAIELVGYSCHACGVFVGPQAPPNWVNLPTPNPNWVAVKLFCPNGACKAPMGTYSVPVN
jgi:hypothetical protein